MSFVPGRDNTGTPLSELHASLELALQPWRGEPGNLLPVLHAVQKQLGYIPQEAVPWLASQLQRSRAEIQGVISFYHDFRQTPPAPVRVQVCMAESCLAMGARTLHEHACRRLDGANTQACGAGQHDAVQKVYCLGLCAQSPVVAINGMQHARMTPEKLDCLLDTGKEHA